MRKTRLLLLLILASSLNYCNTKDAKQEIKKHRFFSDDSFWNQPVPDNPEIDSLSNYWIGLLKKDPSKKNFGINTTAYTIPIYTVDENTPKYKIKPYKLSEKEKEIWKTDRDYFGHGKDFDEDSVPIPDEAMSDPESDHHLALINWKTNTVWDMWGAVKQPDGTWISNTGMKYSLNGSGVFKTEEFKIINGESVHFHGPGRAAGVPIIAGLILLDEVKAGEINHKIAAAIRFNAFQEFVFPAAWSDGNVVGGIPEGSVIQLDPGLDLSEFNLLPGELVIARALQKYGMVLVDNAGGNVLYAQGFYKEKLWNGIIRGWDTGGIETIPLDHYRVLKVGETIKKGDARAKVNKNETPVW